MSKNSRSGIAAVRHIEEHEQRRLDKRFWQWIDWKEFFHMLIIWLAGAVVILTVLVASTMTDAPTDIVHSVVERLDTLSLMFSLIFSATLEQLWYDEKKAAYRVALFAELYLSVLGLIFYLVFSVLEKTMPDNIYYLGRYHFNLFYIVAVVFVVVSGFVARAYKR